MPDYFFVWNIKYVAILFFILDLKTKTNYKIYSRIYILRQHKFAFSF